MYVVRIEERSAPTQMQPGERLILMDEFLVEARRSEGKWSCMRGSRLSSRVVVPCLTNLLPSHLIPMNTTIDRMIVDAQGALASSKLALSPLRGSLQRFCHYSSRYRDLPAFLLY